MYYSYYTYHTKYYGEFIDRYGFLNVIYIKKRYLSTVLEEDAEPAIKVKLGSEPYKITMEGNTDNKFNSIHCTSAELQLISSVNFQYIDLFTCDNLQYKVIIKLYYGSGGSYVVFDGFIVPDVYSEPLQYVEYNVTIQCNDGLPYLKSKYVIDEEGNSRSGPATLKDLIISSLSQISNNNIRLVCNLRINTDLETYGFTSQQNNDAQSTALGMSFINTCGFDWKAFANKTYYELLENILSLFLMEIRFNNGVWLIFRTEQLTGKYIYETHGVNGETNAEQEMLTPVYTNIEFISNESELNILPGKKDITITQDLGMNDSLMAWNLYELLHNDGAYNTRKYILDNYYPQIVVYRKDGNTDLIWKSNIKHYWGQFTVTERFYENQLRFHQDFKNGRIGLESVGTDTFIDSEKSFCQFVFPLTFTENIRGITVGIKLSNIRRTRFYDWKLPHRIIIQEKITGIKWGPYYFGQGEAEYTTSNNGATLNYETGIDKRKTDWSETSMPLNEGALHWYSQGVIGDPVVTGYFSFESTVNGSQLEDTTIFTTYIRRPHLNDLSYLECYLIVEISTPISDKMPDTDREKYQAWMRAAFTSNDDEYDPSWELQRDVFTRIYIEDINYELNYEEGTTFQDSIITHSDINTAQNEGVSIETYLGDTLEPEINDIYRYKNILLWWWWDGIIRPVNKIGIKTFNGGLDLISSIAPYMALSYYRQYYKPSISISGSFYENIINFNFIRPVRPNAGSQIYKIYLPVKCIYYGKMCKFDIECIELNQNPYSHYELPEPGDFNDDFNDDFY